MTALLLTAALFAAPGCVATDQGRAGAATDGTSSAEQPQVLSEAQAEALAGMRYKNFADGIVTLQGWLLGGESGDLTLSGWLDFGRGTGYVRVVPKDAAVILVVWNESELVYLDVPDAGQEPEDVLELPPETLPAGDWRREPLVAETSGLTRMLAALLMLSSDRPENPLLLRQSGARFLGREEVAGAPVDRFSGVSVKGLEAEEADLGSQYWLDADGRLVRFGLRAAGSELSTVDLLRDVPQPSVLPNVDAVGTSDAR